jgi:hypothetical protein
MAEISPKTVRVLRVSCDHVDGGFRVHLTDADWDALVEEFATLQRLNEDLQKSFDDPDGGPLARALARSMYHAEQQRRREAEATMERNTDWHQQRYSALRKWVNEEVRPLSEEAARRYFAICANGSPAPHEAADWSETMHGLRLRAEHVERKLTSTEKALAHLRDLAQDLSDEGCSYGDGCPTFRSRHGTCHACMGRKALGHGDEARARMAREDKEAE